MQSSQTGKGNRDSRITSSNRAAWIPRQPYLSRAQNSLVHFVNNVLCLTSATACFVMVHIHIVLLLTVCQHANSIVAGLGGQAAYRNIAPTPTTPLSSAGSSIKVMRAPVRLARLTSKSAVVSFDSGDSLRDRWTIADLSYSRSLTRIARDVAVINNSSDRAPL